MYTQFITYKNSSIAVTVMGSGPQLLLCLHGFGEDGKSFAFLEKTLGNIYTMIAPDFPFHGETVWNEDLLLLPEELAEILALSFKRFDPANISNPSFSLLAYSFGGRVALQIIEEVPEKIERAVLLAPDGLRVNFWYWLGTQTWLGSRLFDYTMHRPGWFLKLIGFAQKIKMLNKSVIKFVHYYLDDKDIRIALFKRWTTMRRFKPDLAAIKKGIALHQIPVRFVFGSYDRIILSKRSDFFKTDPEHIKIISLDTGHQLLKQKHAATIAALFSD